jgi:hypothetical protein
MGLQGGADAQNSNDWYALRVSPSCPPDKRLYMQGGLVYCTRDSTFGSGTWDYRAYTVPSLVADLADPAQVTVDVTFTNANWYKVYVLLLKRPLEAVEPTATDWTFWLWGTDTELETSTEAEAHMTWETMHDSWPWYDFRDDYHGYPLCGVVLRNDGNTGVSGAFLPVGFTNRGGSYQWPVDLRPRRLSGWG